MSTLTVRLPEDTAARLRRIARARGLSMNKLIEELSTQAIASFDAEARFKAMAASADIEAARQILDRLETGTESGTE